jgi:hypothetical protein
MYDVANLAADLAASLANEVNDLPASPRAERDSQRK